MYGYVSLANISESAESKTTKSAADSAVIPRNTLKSSFQLRACRPRNEKCETRVALRCGSTTVRASLVDFLKGPIGYLHDRSGPFGATKTSFVSPRFDSYFAKIANRVASRKGKEKEDKTERERERRGR